MYYKQKFWYILKTEYILPAQIILFGYYACYCVGAYSRNSGQHSILARKGTKNFNPFPYSVPFLSVLHQNKALYNFHKRGQISIVECNKVYALIVPGNERKESKIFKKIRNLHSKFKFKARNDSNVLHKMTVV